MQVSLNNLELSSEIVSGSVVVGSRPSLPAQGISVILGNDIAGGEVEANPYVSDTPSHDVSGPDEAVVELFLACIVMHVMAWRALNQAIERDVGQSHTKETPELSPLSSSTSHVTLSVTIQSSSKAIGQEKPEVTPNPVLPPKKLVEEQTKDPELCNLRDQALIETKAHKIPL